MAGIETNEPTIYSKRYRRRNWIIAPLAFGIIFRLSLYIYFQSHGTSVFFEGKMDAWSVIVMASYGIVLSIMSFVLPRIRIGLVILASAITSLLVVLMSLAAGGWLWVRYGPLASIFIPTTVGTVIVLLFFTRYQIHLKD